MADDQKLPLIEPTGERFVRTTSEAEIELEHVHRYRAASRLCAGKLVLDAASGEGYGSDILRAAGAKVVGVEIDLATVEASRLRYPGVDFVQGDVARLPFPDAHFDVITSFETLEHIPDPQSCLNEFRRVLKPGGVLIISTPDKTIYNRYLAEPNPFHLHELERQEFRQALEQRFRNVALYGQRVVFGSLLTSALGGRLDTARRVSDGTIAEQDSFDGAMYLVALCSDGALPDLPQSLYEGGVPQNALSSLLGGIEDRDRALRALRQAAAGDAGAAAAAAANDLAREAEEAIAALALARAEADEAQRRLRRVETEVQPLRSQADAAARSVELLEARLTDAVADLERVSDERGALLQLASETTIELTGLRAEQAALSEALAAQAVAAAEKQVRADTLVRQLTEGLNEAAAQAHEAERRTLEIAKSLDEAAGDARFYRTRLNDQAKAVRALHADLTAIHVPSLKGVAMALARDLLFAIRRNKRAPRAAARDFLSLQAIRRSGLFLDAFYGRGRADLAGTDLVRHYYAFGVKEAQDPSPLFSNAAYLRDHPEVQRLGYNPLAHFVRFGRHHGWTPTPSLSLASAIPTLAAAQPPSRALPRPPTSKSPSGAAPFVQRAPWRAASDPAGAEADFSQYEIRPDDATPREAHRGAQFLARHRLLSERPDHEGAVRALNARSTHALGGGDADVPVASIVVPVYGQLGYTLNCLDALLSHKSRHSFEVIVVDDASPDSSGEHLPRVDGIRYHRQPQNGGFIKSSNAGAELARGAVLVMLNNDTRVVEGWLDELLETLATSPDVGMVGSKLFYPDGSLQEAGGIVWRDGSAWNYGRDDDPNRPEYCYARRVDYVSGASIAVPAELWRSLGGFDEHYLPAYCEDSDLAFRIRKAGRETWMQPLSRVIHYEGKTSGTETGQGIKAYQVTNSKKLLERWRESLGAHRPNAEQPWLEKDRAFSKRVLVLDASMPTPDQDAGSVTTVKVIQVFQSLGYKVVFAPIHNFLYQRKYTGDLQRMGVECLYAPFNLDLETHLSEHGHEYDVVHIFRHDVMRRAIKAVRAYCPRALVMFNNMDLHYLRLQRQAAVEGHGGDDVQTVKAAEMEIMNQADLVFVPSTHEQNVLLEERLGRPVLVMPYMVDEEAPLDPAEDAADVVFLGGFQHIPNVDAVLWFHSEIWPLIADARPDARFVIVGSKPPQTILDLRSERVIVTGRVDDLRPAFESAKAFVAPLRFGAGVKGKIYSALSLGTPVVTTTVGAEGIGLTAGENALIADTTQEMAEAVIRLFTDRELEQRLRNAGPKFVSEHATLQAGTRVMSGALLRPEAHRAAAG